MSPGRRRQVRPFLLASLLAVAALIASPGSAGAATTIGETFSDSSGACGTNETVLQTGSPNGQYAAPSDGVITSWTFQAASAVPDSIKFKVGRSAGGNNFLIVGESPEKTPDADTANTYTDVRIPVQAGDVIGYWAGSGPVALCGRNPGPPYLFRFRLGDQPPGTTEPYTENSGFQINFSARLEPDADHDSFGDETQDKCVGTAGPFNGCPNTVTAITLKQKGDTKVKATITVPGQGALKVGSASDPALASAAAKKTVKAVSQTITATTAQQLKLTLKLTRSAKAKLADKGKLKVKVKAVYTPTGGPSGSVTAKKKLKS
jgi:hypothetical protein